MKIIKPIITLALATLALAACQNDILDHTGANSTQIRNINISIPTLQTPPLQGGSTGLPAEEATRTITTGLKTMWDEGDVVYIGIHDITWTFFATLTATYTADGWQFSAQPQVPMNVDEIYIKATYISDKQPSIDPNAGSFFDTDVLHSAINGYNLRNYTDGQAIPLANFNHFCSRIRFTGLAAGDKIEFQGSQWKKVYFYADDYGIGVTDFNADDHLTVAAGEDEAVPYALILTNRSGLSAPQFRINSGEWHTFDPGPENATGDPYANRTYVVDCTGLAGGGGIDEVPIPKEEAEAQRFIAWAQATTGGWRDEGFTLQCDIDISSVANWVPIGPNSSNFFRQIFDGGGHTISGLNIDRPTEDHVGLFGCIIIGTVKNLTVEGNVTGKEYTGGIAGTTNSNIISGCTFRGTVTGKGSYVGGIAGHNAGLITGCQVMDSDITGSNYVCGIAGFNGITGIIACLANGVTLESTGTTGTVRLGGITTDNNTSLVACIAAPISMVAASGPGVIYTGGIAGVNYSSGTATACYWQTGSGYTTAFDYDDNAQEANCTSFTAGSFPTATAIDALNAAIVAYNDGQADATLQCPFRWQAGAGAGALPTLISNPLP